MINVSPTPTPALTQNAVEASDSLMVFDWTSAAPMPISLKRKANPVKVQTMATRPY